jgi:hypothetical protein
MVKLNIPRSYFPKFGSDFDLIVSDALQMTLARLRKACANDIKKIIVFMAQWFSCQHCGDPGFDLSLCL